MLDTKRVAMITLFMQIGFWTPYWFGSIEFDSSLTCSVVNAITVLGLLALARSRTAVVARP